MGKAQNPDEVANKTHRNPEPFFSEIDRAKRVKLIREISERERISERPCVDGCLLTNMKVTKDSFPRVNMVGKQVQSPRRLLTRLLCYVARYPREASMIITILEMEGLVAPEK